MAAHLPPVPPENRSQKGTGESAHATPHTKDLPKAPDNTAIQDRMGNTKENTTNKGYEQDR